MNFIILPLMGVVLLFGLFSCDVNVHKGQKEYADFFKLGDLIDDQSYKLSENKALLYKQAYIDDEYSDQLLMHEACTWAKELEIFKEADLNVPALTHSYTYTFHEVDSGYLHSWKSLYPHETKVDEFIVFKNHLEQALLIYTTMKYGNYLYKTVKNFELKLEAGDNQDVLLTAYKIEGWKKLLNSDTTFYRLVGEIR